VNVDDLLVGSDRWRMASLAIEPDGSVMMSVVPSAVSAICPPVWDADVSAAYVVSAHGVGPALA